MWEGKGRGGKAGVVAGLRLVLVLGQLLLRTITITTTRVGYWFGGTWREEGG